MTDFPEEINYKDIFFLFNKYYSTLAIDSEAKACSSRDAISNKEEVEQNKHDKSLNKQFGNAVKQAIDSKETVSSNMLKTDPNVCSAQSILDINVIKCPPKVKKFLSLPSIATVESRSTIFGPDENEGMATLLQKKSSI